jgi:ABC-type transport system involved in multi-copper enzyme maturation permease subunit
MMLLPIAERELRVATRKSVTYWSRVLAGLIAASLVVWMLGTLGTLVSPDLLGARMFKLLSRVAFFCCLLPGVVLTADCISHERREGTLGLLFLTDLRGHDVVIGKLIATSLRAFYGLIAVFPFLAISFCIGGVTFGEFWRVILALLNTLWLSLTVGLFVSAISWRDQRSMLTTAVILLGVAYLLPATAPFAGVLSPQVAFTTAFDQEFSRHSALFAGTLFAVNLLGWIFLIAAARVVSLRVDIPASRDNKTAAAVRIRSPLMETHPAEWLACRVAQHGWLWLSLTLPIAVWGAGVVSGQKWWNPLSLLAVVFGLHLLLQFWLGWESARRLNELRRDGGLELLLSTPLADRQIIQGQAVALERQFGPPLFAVLALDTILIILSRSHFKWEDGEAFEFFTMTASMIFGSVVNSYAMAWVGLWEGLKTPRASTAGLRTLTRIVLVPSAVFMLPLYLLIASAGGRGSGLLSGSGVIWAVVITVNAAFFCTIARRRLEREFRFRASGVGVPKEFTSHDPGEDAADESWPPVPEAAVFVSSR